MNEAEGHFFFIPDPESFEKLFSALGVPSNDRGASH